MSAADETPLFTTGQVVDGKYKIVHQLGQGGMGAVYEAVHLGTNRRVALKVILAAALMEGTEVIARFQREAKASGAIDSEHVVQVLDTGVDPGTQNPYMVMEYLAGEDLSDLVHRVGPLAPEVVIKIGVQACLGLQRAHDAGIIHRDIKSANLFLSRRDNEVKLKLLDFGIAKVRADPIPSAENRHLTTSGAMIGSPLYMSPEQARSSKAIDNRADIWSLGIVLYEALTGRTPNHDKDTLGDLLIAICVEPIPPLQSRAPWVDASLVGVIERALERDPAKRFASAIEMHDALLVLSSAGGTQIRQEMLVPLPDELRAFVASGAPAPPTGPPAPVPPMPATTFAGTGPALVDEGSSTGRSPLAMSSVPGVQMSSSVSTRELGASTGGTSGAISATSQGQSPTKRPWWAFTLPIAPLLALIGLLVYKTRAPAHRDPMPEATGIVQNTSATAPPTTNSIAPPALKAATVAVVAPAGAKAELDGVPVAIKNGSIEILGAPGSPHKIKLTLDDAAQEVDVTILESGSAMPSRVELTPKPAIVVKAAGNVKPTAPATATTKPATAATPTQAPPTEPSFKKQF